MRLADTLRFLLRHPLNRSHRARALRRFLGWQLGMRILPAGAAVVPFVGGIRLVVERGMTGATGNLYAGLHEFEDMSFVMHALRAEDLFVDVGANVGSYTVLAAGVARARCLSFEPIPRTYERLVDNVVLNRLDALVEARKAGIGAKPGTLRFTTGHDTVNHALASGEADASTVEVEVLTLDDTLNGRRPAILKVDVEGFETEVVAGAEQTLRDESLLGVVMELNGSGARYGFDEGRLFQRMLGFGFTAAAYHPFERRMELAGRSSTGNTIFVRETRLASLTERLASAPRREINGVVF